MRRRSSSPSGSRCWGIWARSPRRSAWRKRIARWVRLKQRGGEKKKKDERQSSSKSAVKRGIQREMRYWRGRGVEGRNPFWFAASFVFPSTPSAARTREKREGGEEEPLQINRESYASKYLFHGRNFRWLYRQIEHTGIINLSYY